MATEQYPKLDARHLARALWRRAPLIAGLVVAAFVLTYAISSLESPVYTGTAEVQVDVAELYPNAKSTTDPVLMNSEIYTVKAAAVREGVINELGGDAAKIIKVNASTVTDTNVLRISASSESPEIAKAAANSYAHNYTDQRQARLVSSVNGIIDSTQSQIDNTKGQIETLTADIIANPNTSSSEVNKLLRSQLLTQQATLQKQLLDAKTQADTLGKAVTVTKEAGNPRLPDSPNPLRDAGVAAMVALVFGIGLAFLLEQLDNRVKTAEQVDLATDGVPVLGTVPVYGGSKHTRRFRSAPRTLVAASSPAAESYHTLATSLRFSSIGKEKRTILVTSSSGGEGKTTVTANLAAVLAESGLRVVVVSADLRRPMLGELLGVPDNQKGLTSAMLGDSDLSSCFVSVTLPSGKSLFVLPAGPLPHEPSVLLGSDMFGTVLDQIKQAGADFILIDCAPVLPVSDPLAASRHVDGVIVLSLYGKTKIGNLRQTVTRLRQVDADIIGVVLNGVPAAGGYYGYYGNYGYRPKEPPTMATGSKLDPPPMPPASPNGSNGSSGGNGSGAPGDSGGRRRATPASSEPATTGRSETGQSSAEHDPTQS
ncbi:MAG: polysaccharide biosynthesis tyrosine autokinase [Acidimicrobiales bacterium]